jgi:hypothetical protein
MWCVSVLWHVVSLGLHNRTMVVIGNCVRYEFLTAWLNNMLFWNVMPWSLVEVYWRSSVTPLSFYQTTWHCVLGEREISWGVVGLKWRSLNLMSTIEELLGRNSKGSSLENIEYGRVDPLRWPRDTLYPQKLTLTLPTSSGQYSSLED